MRYRLFTLATFCIFGLMTTGITAQSQSPSQQPPRVSGAVFRVNNDALTSNQIIDVLQAPLGDLARTLEFEPFAAKAQKLISREVYNQLYNLVIYQRAQSELDRMEQAEEILQSALDSERKQILRDYGGSEARARAELAEEGTSIDEILEGRKRALVISAYRDAHFNTTLEITRNQLLQYYRAHIADYTTDASIRFRLIDVQVREFLPQGADTPPEEQSQARRQAYQQAQAALQRIQDGADFGDVAKELSHGIYRKLGGLWRPRRPESFPVAYQPVIKALTAVSIGRYTGIIEGEERFFIAMLVEREGGHVTLFGQAQFDIQAKIRQQRWEKFSQEMAEELLGNATTGDIESFIKATVILAHQQLSTPSQP